MKVEYELQLDCVKGYVHKRVAYRIGDSIKSREEVEAFLANGFLDGFAKCGGNCTEMAMSKHECLKCWRFNKFRNAFQCCEGLEARLFRVFKPMEIEDAVRFVCPRAPQELIEVHNLLYEDLVLEDGLLYPGTVITVFF